MCGFLPWLTRHRSDAMHLWQRELTWAVTLLYITIEQKCIWKLCDAKRQQENSISGISLSVGSWKIANNRLLKFNGIKHCQTIVVRYFLILLLLKLLPLQKLNRISSFIAPKNLKFVRLKRQSWISMIKSYFPFILEFSV